jgi:hypothetical protein
VSLGSEQLRPKEAKKEMKKMFDLTPRLISIALFLFSISYASSTAQAQDVVYDWAGRAAANGQAARSGGCNALPDLDSDTVGLAISAGPAIRFGSKSDLATLGFFTGPSLHLHRRFFVTAGVHIGEFADFPAGFINNSQVPANFGELKPVKRWTGTFF